MSDFLIIGGDLLRRVDWLRELARNGSLRPEEVVESATAQPRARR